uniref:Uncharacterized protein n=1 Tax=Trichogramma kaykai TaxID=54128 RepID=A0ABD2XK54_9HYME
MHRKRRVKICSMDPKQYTRLVTRCAALIIVDAPLANYPLISDEIPVLALIHQFHRNSRALHLQRLYAHARVFERVFIPPRKMRVKKEAKSNPPRSSLS